MVAVRGVDFDPVRFLAEASHALASSLDYATTLDTVARQAVPAIADCCMIYLLDAEGRVHRVGMAHRDPVREARMIELLTRFSPRTDFSRGTSKVLRTGSPELLPEIPDSLLVEVARDDEHLAFLRGEELNSLISVPLRARGRTLGAITLFAAGSRRYGIADLDLAEDLARRAAIAVDNALLYNAACEAKAAAETALAARERGDRLLQAVLDHTPAMISIQDRDGRYVIVNRQFERCFALDRTEVVGRTSAELFPTDLARALDADRDRVLAGNASLEVEETLASGGESRSYLAIKFSFAETDAACEPDMVCVVRKDITEWRRLEAEVAQAHKMEALGRLAGGVAHDFNNILTSLRGFSELLVAGLAGNPLRQYAERIHASASRASALSERLLAFCRPRETRMEIVDLGEIVRGVEAMLAASLDHARLHVELDATPALVDGDPGELEQVVLNLALNARDAVAEGGEIRIATRHELVDGARHVVLSVSDDGHGMDDATRRRLFEPFFTTKGMGRGTGLGLFTTYATVQRYGGHIAVRSKPGCGSVFEVRLPAAARTRVVAPPPVAVGASSDTILVVEDDEDVRGLISDVLGFCGYNVLRASSAPDALEMFARHRDEIDLLVTDIVMPELDGCELARRLRLEQPWLPVLYVSGYSGDILGRYGVPPETVLSKPYAIDVLRQRVHDALAAGDGGSRRGRSAGRSSPSAVGS